MAANSEKEISDPVAGFAPASFAVGFDRKQGESFVYGCVVFTILVAVVGVAAQVPYLALGSLVPLAIAYWHYPMIEKGLPQLAADRSGLFVERLGLIDWAAIQGFDLRKTSVRNIILVKLDIGLNRPVDQAVIRPHQVPFWKKVMMRNWKINHGGDKNCVTVELHPLVGSPEEILSRLQTFKSN